MKLLISSSLLLCLSAFVFGQKESVTAGALFIGIAQPTAIKLPLPDYPKGAKKANLAGQVSVAVSIDDHGKIKDVSDADGPYPVCQAVADPNVLELRVAATAAAEKAVFAPAQIGQTGVPAKGRITYDFSLGRDPDKQGATPLDIMMRSGESTSTPGAAALAITGSGKTKDPRPLAASKMVVGGVLNGTAMSLPKPTYPAAARAIRAGGPVKVQVLIDENGAMYAARALSGHPLLKRSSEIASCSAKFTPTLLSGEPVKVMGVIVYNYVP